MDLRIASYNVKCFPWLSTPIHQIAQWIVTKADVVALQEVWCRHDIWAAAFAAAGWTFVRPTREAHILGIFGSGLAVAFRSALWDLTDARFYPYMNAIGIDVAVTKGWFRTCLTHRLSGRPVRLINTHMQSDIDFIGHWTADQWTDPIRRQQVLQLTAAERTDGATTLLIGDFNTRTCWFAGRSWLETDTGSTFADPEQSIDHAIQLGGPPCSIVRHHIEREAIWSDHWPVFWHLRVCSGQKKVRGSVPQR